MRKIRWVGAVLVIFLVFAFAGISFGEENFKNPEEVVRAFILQRAKYSFFMKETEYANYCRKVISFISNGEKYFDEYCGGGVPIIRDFSIINSSIKGDHGEIIVEHNFCGICANDLSCLPEKKSEKGTYKLIKKDGFWKIEKWYSESCPFPCDGWISIKEVLRLYDFILSNYSKFKYLGSKEEIKQTVSKLKKSCMEVK
mgnify:FL=1